MLGCTSEDTYAQACPETRVCNVQQVIIEDISAKEKGIKVIDTDGNSDNLKYAVEHFYVQKLGYQV